MTPVFCCGFECGVTGAHWTLSAGGGFDTTTKRSGARSFKLTGGVSSLVTNTIAFSSAIAVLRMYVYFTDASTAVCLVRFKNGSSGKGGFTIDTGPVIKAVCGPNASSTGIPIVSNRWYCIDVKLDISNNPWTCDVKVDGVSATQATNAVAASTYTSMLLADSLDSVSDIYFDDIILSQTTGDYPIGPGYVNHFVPTSDGTHNVAGANDFERSATGTDITNATTTAFQLIDDLPLETGAPTDWINLIAPPNSTDYVEVIFGAASGINTPLVAPRAVEVVNAYTSSATGTNNLRLAVNDNGTLNDAFNANAALTTTNCKYTTKQYASGPAGAWTVAAGAGNFNNLRMRCFTSDAAPDPYWVSAMVEAEFKEILFIKPLNINQSVNRAANW